jgi:hypothetical protein
MWRKIDDIAARRPRLAHALTESDNRDAYVVTAMHRVCDANLRHADAQDCRAKDAVKV